MNRNWILPAAIAAVVLVIACCCCVALIGVGTYLIPSRQQYGPSTNPLSIVTTSTPVVIRPTAAPTRDTLPTPGPSLEDTPAPEATLPPPIIGSGAEETLKTLSESVVPINDFVDLAARLEGITGVPATLPAPAQPFEVGDQQTFWASNTDTNENFQVYATLRYITDHSYFWIENGVQYRQQELKDLAETFENKIYPTDREFFGSEWTPGIDDDPHLYILYARGLGSSVAGYFSTTDSYNPQIQEYSNGHEMFDFNADNTSLSDEFTYGVLAHEFQHMIHWYRDRNEELWMNEGFSDLAMLLNGYTTGGHDFLFVQDPDLQLNDWPNDETQTVPHYGASFLFTAYFLDRFGEEATKAVVADQENGLKSIDDVLQSLDIRDGLTGEQITADDVFTDWTIATYLLDGKAVDGRYIYHNYPGAPQTYDTERIRTCASSFNTRDVHQYGTDYIWLDCSGLLTLHFEGSTQVGVLPENAHSGRYAFWSNKGGESDMTLTQTFDFSGQSGPLSLDYWTWYDIETDFDYVYVEASTDGQNWTQLHTPSGTDRDITGANYGWGYTGVSGGDAPAWIQESVDLSQYAGQKVQLRFEYITDAAVNGEGLLLDDISIPQIGYSSDFENDNGGWDAQGFVRIENALPQSFRLSIIRQGSSTTVDKYTLTGDNGIDIPLDFSSGDRITLVVSGTARFTRQPTAYRFNFQP